MNVGTREEWVRQRIELLKEEKALNRQRDNLAARRRALPWVPIDKDYVFDGADGETTLPDLFGEHSQLLTYHFMFGPDWDEGCPSCSFLTDCFDGTGIHLAHRDVTLVWLAHTPYEKLAASRERMGWTTPFFSSARSDFNHDFHVSFTASETENASRIQLHKIRASVRGTARHQHVREDRRRPRVPHVLELRTRSRSPRDRVPAPRPGTEGPR